ncbi:MAG: DUF58 domain-containing protein [Eubacteriales bacterium]|nr:DUF58 domain-containing protein [Eubacteriales bacterium]MDD4139395.1 DUF58 domain-containing protein [Eubacteriales bacterium]
MVLIGLIILFVALVALQRHIYGRFWSRHLTVDLVFSAKTGVEGGSVKLTEVITSRKALPLPWLTVKFQVSRHLIFSDKLHATITDDYYREDLFSLGMYQRIRRTLPVIMKKRGYYTIKSIDLVSSDLLLTRKLVDHARSHSVLTVCPRLIPREDFAVPYSQIMGEILARTALLPDPFEFRGIREYQGFDTMRSINWLATARSGTLKVNVHEYTASRDVIVLLNVEPDGAFYEEELLEEGIRIAATLCDNLIQEGVSCGLVSNARDIITGETIDIASGQSSQHIQQIQEQLGRLDLTRKPEAFAPLLLQHGFSTYRDPVLLLISLNCSDGICRAWSDCLGRVHDGLWILPRYADRQDRLPDTEHATLCWEVKRRAR